MLSDRYDFSGFTSLAQSSDGRFTVGRDGVTEILSPADRRSEFIRHGERTDVRLLTAIGPQPLYPLSEPRFTGPATAVLMDLDGTSVQSETFWVWIIEKTLRELCGRPGFSLEDADLPFVSGFSVSEHLRYGIDKYCPGASLDAARQIYHRITAEEMQLILDGRGNAAAFRPAPHLKEFLLAFKAAHVKLGLVTSGLYVKAMPEIVAAFRTLDMGDPLAFYDAIITAGTTYIPGRQAGTPGEIGAKPHPWLYAEIAHVGLGLTEADDGHVVGLEDSSAGVLSVALAGYPVIGMDGGNIAAAGLNGLLAARHSDLLAVLDDIL